MEDREVATLRARWQERSCEQLPPPSDLRGRNTGITRGYARLYLSQPVLFKRMGVSAFSSHRVGILLKLYDAAGLGSAPREGLRANLDLMRAANNEVYEETAWCHFAYDADPDGGMALIERALCSDDRHALLLEGFRHIDEGRRLAAQPGKAEVAAEAIWSGNLLLMRHEQEAIIQPYFARIDRSLGRFMSLLTWMDFDLETVLPPPRRLTARRVRRFLRCALRRSDYDIDFTWFQGCLWLHARQLLRRTRSWPDIRQLEHRWYWIEHHVMPLWRWVEERDPTVPHKMRHILAGPLVP